MKKLSKHEMKMVMGGLEDRQSDFGDGEDRNSWSCTGYGIDHNCFYIGQSCGNGGAFCEIGSNGYCCIHG